MDTATIETPERLLANMNGLLAVLQEDAMALEACIRDIERRLTLVEQAHGIYSTAS
jgi:hypothetical protein